MGISEHLTPVLTPGVPKNTQRNHKEGLFLTAAGKGGLIGVCFVIIGQSRTSSYL